MIKVQNILEWMDDFAPFRYAESWDNCGLQVGNPDAEVMRVLLALDPTTDTLSEAKRLGCECLVTHHPLIFQPLSSVRSDRFPGSLVMAAAAAGVNVVSAHTNLDAARGGTNDQLAQLLGLRPTGALEVNERWKGEERYWGIGRICDLGEGLTGGKLLERVRTAFPANVVRAAGNFDKPVKKVALCSGSGGSLLGQAIAMGCDAYVTGDLKYHEARTAMEAHMALIDVGHFASERLILQPLAQYLEQTAGAHDLFLETLVARKETDPFQNGKKS